MNRELKSSFVHQREVSPRYFAIIENREEILKRDLSQMSIDEFYDCLSFIFEAVHGRADAFAHISSLYYDYVVYAADHGISVNSELMKAEERFKTYHFCGLTSETMAELSKEVVYFSPETLKALGSALSPRGAYLLCALFEGIGAVVVRDLINLHETDLDMGRSEVKLSSGTYKVSSMCMDAIRASVMHPTLDAWFPSIFARKITENCARGYVFPVRGFCRKENDELWASALLRTTMFTIRDQIGLSAVNKTNIVLSGFLNRIFDIYPEVKNASELSRDLFKRPEIHKIASEFGVSLQSKASVSRRAVQMRQYFSSYLAQNGE